MWRTADEVDRFSLPSGAESGFICTVLLCSRVMLLKSVGILEPGEDRAHGGGFMRVCVHM